MGSGWVRCGGARWGRIRLQAWAARDNAVAIGASTRRRRQAAIQPCAASQPLSPASFVGTTHSASSLIRLPMLLGISSKKLMCCKAQEGEGGHTGGSGATCMFTSESTWASLLQNQYLQGCTFAVVLVCPSGMKIGRQIPCTMSHGLSTQRAFDLPMICAPCWSAAPRFRVGVSGC